MKTNVLKVSFISLITLVLTLNIAQAQLETGKKLIANESYNKAKSFFLSQISSGKSKPEMFLVLSDLYIKTSKKDSAQIIVNHGLKLYPSDLYCKIAQGKLFALANNGAEAEKLFDEVLEQSKYKNQSIILEVVKGKLLSNLSSSERITELLTKAKELDKKSADLYMTGAEFYKKNEKTGEAANEYERAIFFNPGNVEAQTKLGDIYALAVNYKQSLAAYQNALQIDSMFLPALRGIAELYYSYGNYPKASEYYSKYIQNAEYDVKDKVRYASVLYFNKEYKKSLEVVNQLALTDPENMVVKRLMAYNQFETKDYPGAYASITKVFQIKDTSKLVVTDYEYYGKILSKNAKDSLAIGYYLTALSKDSTKIDLFENIAQSYDKMKKFDFAIRYYETLISKRKMPLTTDYFQLGKSCYFQAASYLNPVDSVLKKNMLVKADTVFGIVCVNSPSSYLGLFWKARVNSLLDPETELGLAKPYYEKVIEICETDTAKYKKELIESYQYMGYYLYIKKDNTESKGCWQKVLQLDPTDKKALDAMKGLK